MAIHAPTHLHLSRHRVFYFRITIPAALRTHFGTRELKRSLKTRHRRTAIQLARVCATQYESLFATLQEHPVTYIEMKQLLHQAKDEMFALLNDQLEKNGPLNQESRSKVRSELKVLRTIVSMNSSTPRAQEMADTVLAKADISLPQSSDTYQQFCVESAKMLDALFQAWLAHSESLDSYVSPPKPSPAPTHHLPSNSVQAVSTAPSVGVRQVVEAYCEEKRREGSWTQKTEHEHQAVFELFIQIAGDIPLETISFDTARNYKSVLLKLPPNINKNPLYRGKSIDQVVAMNPQQTMAINTINKNLTRISSLFAWAKKHGYVRENYFDKLTLKKKKRAHEERAAFTRDELAQLFGTAQYQQHRFLHPHYYWLPLLGLYTGARLEELCQLHLDDIRDEDSIPVFDINDTGEKKLKSPSSQRLVPIHPKLMALGLLEHVTTLRDKGETRLFPKLKRGRDGYSQAASRWFSRYREPLGLHNQTPRKDFHSFRHTFANALKQQGFPEDQVATLIGHSKSGISFDRYGKPYIPAFLIDVIKTLDYDDALEAVQPFYP